MAGKPQKKSTKKPTNSSTGRKNKMTRNEKIFHYRNSIGATDGYRSDGRFGTKGSPPDYGPLEAAKSRSKGIGATVERQAQWEESTFKRRYGNTTDGAYLAERTRSQEKVDAKIRIKRDVAYMKKKKKK